MIFCIPNLGNKYRKLKYILAQEKPPMVISMGGRGRIICTHLAYACHEKGPKASDWYEA